MHSLEILISDSIRYGTIIRLGEERYECLCGKILKRHSLRNHFRTKYHQSRCEVEILTEECCVCYDNKSEWYECSTCHQKHCSECHAHPTMSKCPLCRAPFHSGTPFHRGDELEWFIRRVHNTISMLDASCFTEYNDLSEIGVWMMTTFYTFLVANKTLLDQLPDLKDNLLEWLDGLGRLGLPHVTSFRRQLA